MSAKQYLVYDNWYGSIYGVYEKREDAEKEAKMASVRKDRAISIYYHDRDIVAKVIDDKIFAINI